MSKKVERFEDFKLNKQLLDAIVDTGYKLPTPIQQKAIPIALAGHDVLGIAQTGTGKTAAFALPLLMKIKYAREQWPTALILAPTKELVIQIERVIRKYSTYLDIRMVSLYGGVGPTHQIEQIEQGVDILVSTPGRFLDLYDRAEFQTKYINTLVLDEADKMMEMGFMDQIRSILEKIPVKRQNMLFSATFPPRVEHLSEEFLEFPIRVEVAPQSTVTKQVQQSYYEVPNFKTKINLLGHLLEKPEFSKVIIFVRTKELANNIFKFIGRKLESATRVIHSNKAQQSRINAIRDFNNDDVKFLVTTDVTARGHDIHGISHVINFDVPHIHEDYVHRIGRTGRSDKEGKAITFADPAEMYNLRKIEDLIGEKISKQPVPEAIITEPTSKEESISQARQIDYHKRKNDPNYQGAFHEKKQKPKPIGKSGSSKKNRRKR